MDYSVSICDDNEVDRAYLSGLVRKWAEKTGREVRISEYPSAEQFLFHFPEQGADLLLLDIEMGGMDGVSLAKKLRSQHDALEIVFNTGYSDYIAEGYEVSALHYLMKPVKEEKLFSVLDRAVEKIQKNERQLILETGGELVRLPIYRIRYADVQGNYVTVHADGDHTAKMTLSQLEKLLDDRFYRVGRSAIVNLTQISRVTRTDIFLQDGTAIPLPRGAYEGVNQAIIRMG
ncbi:MAG: LytR/AlgR family response regulator transcription factor [Faecousia sp.]